VLLLSLEVRHRNNNLHASSMWNWIKIEHFISCTWASIIHTTHVELLQCTFTMNPQWPPIVWTRTSAHTVNTCQYKWDSNNPATAYNFFVNYSRTYSSCRVFYIIPCQFLCSPVVFVTKRRVIKWIVVIWLNSTQFIRIITLCTVSALQIKCVMNVK